MLPDLTVRVEGIFFHTLSLRSRTSSKCWTLGFQLSVYTATLWDDILPILWPQSLESRRQGTMLLTFLSSLPSQLQLSVLADIIGQIREQSTHLELYTLMYVH